MQNPLIRDLKADHLEILRVLEQVREAGVTSETGQRKLAEVRRLMERHLRTEDEHFYPPLRLAAERDEELRRTLEYFAHDMEVISLNAYRFFERYAGGGSGLEFARDFGRLYATVLRRQQKEEQILYRSFEECA